MEFHSVNPATEKIEFSHKPNLPEEIDDKLTNLTKGFMSWRRSGLPDRTDLLIKLADRLDNKKHEMARCAALEMGKPLVEGIAEVEKCARLCRYYVQEGPLHLADIEIPSGTGKSYVSFSPLGVVFGIMPWNFPFWQVFRFAIPAIMAGNTALLKHAPNTFQCAEMIGSMFANLTEHTLFDTVICDHRHAALVIADPRIAAVTFTGSSKGGASVAEIAGRNLKKTVLELGGSDPYVILADADIDAAAKACVTGRFINNGQSCIAAKRFIVEAGIAMKFEEAITERIQALTWGDPLGGVFDLGPMARQDLRKNLHEQVQQSVRGGAKLRLGGKLPESPGYFYPPTLLTDVHPGMRVFEEETFGPVAVMITAEDAHQAMRLAAQTSYGLGAAIFSTNIEKAERLARDILEAGSCFVNDYVRSDPRLPFGGTKNSGYGRELSQFGLHEFTNVKTVWIK